MKNWEQNEKSKKIKNFSVNRKKNKNREQNEKFGTNQKKTEKNEKPRTKLKN